MLTLAALGLVLAAIAPGDSSRPPGSRPSDSAGAFKPASADTASSRATRPPHHVFFKGRAPPGAKVSLDSAATFADSTGSWRLSVPMDSTPGVTGGADLCLEQAGQKACIPVKSGGYDSIELAPLHFTESAAVDSLAAKRPSDSAAADSSRQSLARKAKLLDEGKETGKRLVVVRGRKRPKAMGQDKVTAQQIKRLPGLAEPDVIRAVQALPGVVASSDFSTKMYVRGSASDEKCTRHRSKGLH